MWPPRLKGAGSTVGGGGRRSPHGGPTECPQKAAGPGRFPVVVRRARRGRRQRALRRPGGAWPWCPVGWPVMAAPGGCWVGLGASGPARCVVAGAGGGEGRGGGGRAWAFVRRAVAAVAG